MLQYVYVGNVPVNNTVNTTVYLTSSWLCTCTLDNHNKVRFKDLIGSNLIQSNRIHNECMEIFRLRPHQKISCERTRPFSTRTSGLPDSQ